MIQSGRSFTQLMNAELPKLVYVDSTELMGVMVEFAVMDVNNCLRFLNHIDG